LLELLKPF